MYTTRRAAGDLFTSGAPQSDVFRELVAAHQAAYATYKQDHDAWLYEGGANLAAGLRLPERLRPEPTFDAATFDLSWLCAKLDVAMKENAELRKATER